MNKHDLPDYLTNTDKLLLQEKYPNLEEIIIKLNQNYPVQYLIGNVDFYDCKIIVNENVLIPRFETELLVDKLIHRIQNLKTSSLKVIDLGTGSGCIAIALKKNINVDIIAIDMSEKALEIARENAKENKVNIQFQKADMLRFDLNDFDIIISNPPYVSKKEPIGEEVKYEPENAVFAEKDGLYFYEQILKKIGNSTHKPILIAFEIGMNQASLIKEYQIQFLPEYHFTVEQDYTGKDRFIFLEKNRL